MASPAQAGGFLKKLGQIASKYLESRVATKELVEKGAGLAKNVLSAEEGQQIVREASRVPTSFFDTMERERLQKVYQKANQVAVAVQREIGETGGGLNEKVYAMLRKNGFTEERISFLKESRLYENPSLLRREVRKARVANDRQMRIAEMESEVSNYFSAEQLNDISRKRIAIRNQFSQDADKSLREEYRFLKNHRDMAVKTAAEKGGLYDRLTNEKAVLEATTTISDKISDFAEMSAKAGLQSVRDAALKAHDYFRYSAAVHTKLKNLLTSRNDMARALQAKWAGGDEEKFGRFVRDYVENITEAGGPTMRPLTTLENGTSIGALEMNERLMQVMADAHGVMLSPEMAEDVARFANKQINTNRIRMKAWKMMDDTQYATASEHIPVSFEDIPSDRIVDKTLYATKTMAGDMGIGYMPRVLTPEAAKKRKVADMTDLAVVNSPEGEKAFANSFKARKNATREWEDGKWIPMIDELEHDSTTALSMMIKSLGRKEIDNLNFNSAVMGPAGQQEIPLLKKINENFDQIFSFNKNDSSMFSEVVGLVTDTNKKLFIGTPFATSLNSLQFAMDNMTKSPVFLLKAFGQNIGNLGRLLVSNHANAVNHILKKEPQSELVRYCRNNFFRNYYPEAATKATINLDRIGDPTWAKRVRSVTDAFTFFFESADVFTRLVSADATAMSVESLLKKHAAKKLASPSNYIGDLSKDLSMGVFGYADRMRLVNLMLGDEKRFAAEYVNTVIDKELFNYNRLNRPQFVDWAKGNKYAADAFAFMSFPFYWRKMMMGAVDAAAEGDYKPIGRLALTSAAFIYAAQEASDSDVPVVSKWGNYVKNATYGMYLFPLNAPNRPVGGVLSASFNQMAYPIIWGVKGATEILGVESKAVQFMEMESRGAIKNHAAWRQAKDLIETFKMAGEYVQE